MKRRVARSLGLVAMLALLGACGFKLREQVSLPPNLSTLRIESGDPFAPLQRDLELALRRAGATIVETPVEGVAVLRILASGIDRLPLSVGDTGRVSEFLLRYTVEFELIDSAAVVVLPRQTIEMDRDYTFDTEQALGTPGEEELVRAELERDMVQTLLRRIDAATRGAD
jgi:LPS-assembly lipoprotein